MGTTSPFGKYAAIIAACAAVMVLGAWIATALIPVLNPVPQLDAAALIVLGAIFGTGAGALVVSNGAHKDAAAANARLDAIAAPSAAASKVILDHQTVPVSVEDSNG